MKILLSLCILTLIAGISCNKQDAGAIPIYSFIGSYHLTGNQYCSVRGDTTSYPPVFIDRNIHITRIDVTSLNIDGQEFHYTTSYGDSIIKYSFVSYPITPLSQYFFFHRPFNDDSAFYQFSNGLASHPCTTMLSGAKFF